MPDKNSICSSSVSNILAILILRPTTSCAQLCNFIISLNLFLNHLSQTSQSGCLYNFRSFIIRRLLQWYSSHKEYSPTANRLIARLQKLRATSMCELPQIQRFMARVQQQRSMALRWLPLQFYARAMWLKGASKSILLRGWAAFFIWQELWKCSMAFSKFFIFWQIVPTIICISAHFTTFPSIFPNKPNASLYFSSDASYLSMRRQQLPIMHSICAFSSNEGGKVAALSLSTSSKQLIVSFTHPFFQAYLPISYSTLHFYFIASFSLGVSQISVRISINDLSFTFSCYSGQLGSASWLFGYFLAVCSYRLISPYGALRSIVFLLSILVWKLS